MATPKHLSVYRNEKWYCAKCGNILMELPGDPRILSCVTQKCERYHIHLLRPDLHMAEVISLPSN